MPPACIIIFSKHTTHEGVFGALGAVAAAVVACLYPTGYFGPLSARISGLFVKHTRTGNPLVDSVAEHQPANAGAYMQYLHIMYNVAPFGFVFLLLAVARERIGMLGATEDPTRRIDGKFFLVCYAFTAYYFSSKMVCREWPDVLITVTYILCESC